MCCFSQKVDVVADTNIFARAATGGRQFLVYSMRFKSAADLAMILPLPTPKNSPDDAVKFLNLEKYPQFFEDLRRGFPEKKDDTRGPSQEGAKSRAALPVVEVGKYVASFVPSIQDFARLDTQFRLPEGVWDKLPLYKNWGFAVFKLTKPEKDEQKVHPMAFEFPRANPAVLFFPTVHIHDGTVPAKAKFDHSLFCQVDGGGPMSWEETPGLAAEFTKVKETLGIIDGGSHVYRKLMKGMFENKDVAL